MPSFARRKRGARIRVLLIAFFGFVLMCPSMLRAQQDVGYITGTVTDPSGAVVPQATVKVVNDATGIEEQLTTSSSGFYQTQALAPGHYTVTVARQGFSNSVTPDIVLDAATRQAVNVSLQVGAVNNEVVVVARAPALDTTDGQIGTTINTRAVQELPISGRSALALATLVPGVSTATSATAQGFANRGTQVSAIRIGGGVPGGNNNLLDGATNLQNYLGEVAINVKADAVEEFRIMRGVIPAQFGYTSGGVINVITASGGNQFHGSAYEFFRNDALDAVTPLPVSTFRVPELRFNNYGGTFGGPIVHNRAFFFTNYEEYRYVNAPASYATVPTPQERTGDFSDLRRLVNGVCTQTNIYDPYSGSATVQRTQFPGNVIPSNRLNPISLKAQDLLYPLPNNTSGGYNACTHANNYLYYPKTASTERQGLARVDYVLGAKDTAFARFAYYYNTNNNASGYSNLYARNDNLQNYLGILSETHAFSPSLTNDVRVDFVRSDFPFQSATTGTNFAGQIGMPTFNPLVAPIFSNGLATINATYGFRASTTYEVLDDVTKVFGAHTIRFGVSGRFVEGFNNQASSMAGQFNFSATQTAQGTSASVSAGTGNTYASFLLGAVGSASAETSGGVAYRRWQYAGYVQDDWHATQRLTLNLGLRYDFQQQPYEKHNGIESFDITRVNPLNGYLGAVRYAGVNGEGRNFVDENLGEFGPRAGFALVLTNDNKTVLRGGVAIYYPSTATASYDASAGNQAGFGRTETSYGASTAAGPAFNLSDGLPYAPNQPLGAAGGENAFLGQTGNYVRESAKDPQSQQYTLTLSRELPGRTVLDVSYLGNHGIHFIMPTYDTNTLDPMYFSLGTSYLNASVANPYAGKVPGSLGAATITRKNLLKPFPYMASVNTSFARDAHFDGNYLYVSVVRRSENGLQVQGGYTYGKLMSTPIYTDLGTAPGVTSTAGGMQNWRNPDGDYSVDGIDVQHRLTTAVLYDLPFGRNRKFLSNSALMNRLVGGMQFNTVMTIQGGLPLEITGANNQGIANRPNVLPGVSLHVSHPTTAEWFNTAAFVNPPDYTYGNSPRYFSGLRSPKTVSFDMSVFKRTQITERALLELRLEAFNALNHLNLSAPNTGFTAASAAAGAGNSSSTFGTITASKSGRTVQLGAKIKF